MTVTYVGGITLGAAIPGVNSALLQAVGDVEAKIAACVNFAPNLVPPSLTADIAANATIFANLTASLGANITPPSLSVQLDIIASTLIVVRAQLQIILDLFNLFTANLHLYAYSGQTDALGGEFTTELSAGVPGGAGSDVANALLLITTVPADWAKIAQVFKTTP